MDIFKDLLFHTEFFVEGSPTFTRDLVDIQINLQIFLYAGLHLLCDLKYIILLF